MSVPQGISNNRLIVTPVGKIIGGGSSINATVWLNGDKADYDAWEAAAGPHWGFEQIIRNFKKTERYAGGESAMRGGSGMIATRTSDAIHPVTLAFIESAVASARPSSSTSTTLRASATPSAKRTSTPMRRCDASRRRTAILFRRSTART